MKEEPTKQEILLALEAINNNYFPRTAYEQELDRQAEDIIQWFDENEPDWRL